MEMSNALQKNLMQLFPNKIIYSAELCKNISVHMALHREAKRAGVSSRQLTESNGFVWKDIERAMDFSGEKVDEGLEVVPVINQIYTTQTFLGNAILTEEQRIAVYSYAKSAFDKRFVEGKGLSITEEKAIILETIFALQGRSADDDESQSKIWVFVFKHFCGYTLGQGTTEYQHYYRFFCKAIDKVMRLTNHFLVPTEKNGIRYQGYYDTLLIHALEPADAANRFFSILFDFYVNTLDCQYIPGDPAFKPLVKAIKAKWNDNFDSEVDVRSAVVSASFKTLLELCQGYACVFCEDIIHKMDVITSGYGIDEQLDTKHFRLDLLIYRWFQQQSRGQRKQAQDSRKNHRNDRVAIHRSDIHASYELIDGIAYIVLPKIRFEESDCQLIANGNRPQVVISLDGKDNFIGNKGQDFHVYLYDVEKEPYNYFVYGKDEQLEKNLSLADGAYSFSVTTIKKSVFKKEESEIYSGKLVVGNPYDFNYRNAILKLKSASCWDWEKGVYNVLGLRDSMTRIVDLKYIDVSDAPAEEDGKCPHYQGTLQFWNTKQASWFFFCNDSSKTEFELINPIDIWLISEHFLAMYSVTGDAVYIDAGHGSILNKAERTLSRAEKEALQIPDKFEYEMVKNK